MISKRKRILFLLTFFLLFAACESQELLEGDHEVVLQLVPPEPLSDPEVGVNVGSESASRMMGDVDIDVGAVTSNVAEVMGIVIAIIPAKVHFDTIGTYSAMPPASRGPAIQQENEIAVTFTFAPAGEEDPYQEEFLAARFFLDLQGTEVISVSGSVDIPRPARDHILSGHTRVGISIESTVTGRLSIESADLTFRL